MVWYSSYDLTTILARKYKVRTNFVTDEKLYVWNPNRTVQLPGV